MGPSCPRVPFLLCDWPMDSLPAVFLEVCFSNERNWELIAGVPETVQPSLEPVSAQKAFGLLLYRFVSLFTYPFGSSSG